MPQQRMVFGAAGGGGGARGAIHPLQVNQTMPVPPNFNYGGGVAADGSGAGAATGGVVPIYSHSTITRTTAGPDGTPSHEGGGQNVYIQNNFYTLPSGTELPNNATMNPTPESLQAQQTEMIQNGGAISLGGQQPTPTATAVSSSGAMSAPQYTTPTYSATPSALQPLYPGPNGSETDAAVTVGHLHQQQSQQQQQHIAAISHPTAYSTAGQR